MPSPRCQWGGCLCSANSGNDLVAPCGTTGCCDLDDGETCSSSGGGDACSGLVADTACKYIPKKGKCKKAGCRWNKKKEKCLAKRIKD